MKARIGYKLVIVKASGELISWGGEQPKELCITYTPNEYVVPKVKKSRLFVFDCLLDAKQYCAQNPYDNVEIWRVKYKPSQINTDCIINATMYHNLFWKKLRYVNGGPWPQGTRLATAVMLLERVD